MLVASWQSTVEAIGAGATGVGVVLVFIQIGVARRAQNAQATTDLSRSWDDVALRAIRQEIRRLGTPDVVAAHIRRLRDLNDPRYYQLLREPDFYEDTAVQVRRKSLSKRTVRELLGLTLPYEWDLWKLAVEYLREEFSEGGVYKYFEELAEEMRKSPRSVRIGHAVNVGAKCTLSGLWRLVRSPVLLLRWLWHLVRTPGPSEPST
jgi:hypothetical protein